MKFGTPDSGSGIETAAASEGESRLLLINDPKTPISTPSLQYESVLGESGDGAITLAMPSQPSEVPPTRAQRAPMHKKPSMPVTATAAPAQQVKKDPPEATGAAIQRKPAMPAMPSTAASVAGANPTGYTLQVKAFRTEEAAKKFNQELRQNGYDAFVVRSEIPEKGTWYRVRVGQYASLMKATEYQYHFESKEGLSTFVSPL